MYRFGGRKILQMFHGKIAFQVDTEQSTLVAAAVMALSLNDTLFNFTTIESNAETDEFYNDNEITIQENLAIILNIYYYPVLIVLGCVGNLISIIVFYKSKLRVQSTSLYLSALALSDTLFLCQLLPPWMNLVGASTLFARNGFCQLFMYLSYVTCDYSSWLVVAFTTERFVAVVYPLRLNAIYTVKRARHIVASLAVVALLVNVPVLRFAVVRGYDCDIDQLLVEHAARFNVFDMVVAFTLPLTAIVVLNACIVWSVCRASRARAHVAPRPRPGSQHRVTRMLLIVSSVFVMFNLPAYVLRVIAYANTIESANNWAAQQQIAALFFNTTFGINFVLYCMTGRNFRHALLETFSWLRRRQPTPIALRGHIDPATEKSFADVEPARDTSYADVET